MSITALPGGITVSQSVVTSTSGSTVLYASISGRSLTFSDLGTTEVSSLTLIESGVNVSVEVTTNVAHSVSSEEYIQNAGLIIDDVSSEATHPTPGTGDMSAPPNGGPAAAPNLTNPGDALPHYGSEKGPLMRSSGGTTDTSDSSTDSVTSALAISTSDLSILESARSYATYVDVDVLAAAHLLDASSNDAGPGTSGLATDGSEAALSAIGSQYDLTTPGGSADSATFSYSENGLAAVNVGSSAAPRTAVGGNLSSDGGDSVNGPGLAGGFLPAHSSRPHRPTAATVSVPTLPLRGVILLLPAPKRGRRHCWTPPRAT